MIRYEIMKQFGYYVTESSEHLAEYLPYFIKSTHPELIEKFNIPLDEYPRRCQEQIAEWEERREELVNDSDIEHEKTHEYASYIIKAIETDDPIRIGGNLLNRGLKKKLFCRIFISERKLSCGLTLGSSDGSPQCGLKPGKYWSSASFS
ncbi:Family 4 glycosyl hydrolase C-terminal domain-containing protein [Halarsenatibacter silvermanii]|uniref:Family 4 glycosyl hydrolase C-terminal domain-containing protein n=1 Tax=Halarsenatibacter silvermanii TaxID=321763 RepID=A0A1G9QMZ4_9FIRM|nr:Family 4 glycosyl hydrolase C-terminal domain-containing protein [Halarsenatibacter silvermanii]